MLQPSLPWLAGEDTSLFVQPFQTHEWGASQERIEQRRLNGILNLL